jgi:PAS domain S-box-containing protein
MEPDPFRQLYDILPEPILLVRSDGVLLSVNAAAAQLLGCPASGLLGRTLREITLDTDDKLTRLFRTWERSRKLLPGGLVFCVDGGTTIDCQVEGGLCAQASERAPGSLVLRLSEKAKASSAFRTLTRRIEQLNAEIMVRRRSEAILHGHKEWLRAILASIGEGVLATNAVGEITFLNPVAEELTGWKESEAKGRPVREAFEVVNGITREVLCNPVSEVLLEGRPTILGSHALLIPREGRERFVTGRSTPLHDEGGAISGAVLIFRDVTEQRLAAIALADSQERLRVTLKNAPVFLYTADRDLRYTWIQRPHASIPVEELLGRRDDELFAPEEVRELIELKQRVLDRGAGERKEITLNIGASLEVYDMTVEPLVGDGAVLGVTVAALDVTERARAQEAIRRSEQHFRELANSMPQMVWGARPDGYLDYYNERWYEFTGFPREEGGDQSWAPILHPDDGQYCFDTWYGAVRSGQRYEIEYRFWDRVTERYRWFLGRALPVKNAEGEITRWFGTATDIDDQKRVMEELRQANEGLQQFAYSASHDLQEPLRMIAIYSQLLGRKLENESDEEIAEYLGYTIQGARRMEALVRDLLAYTQAGALDVSGALDEANCRTALEIALENLRLSIEETGAQIVGTDLPVVCAQKIHVVQLFQNLIGNALKYRSGQQPQINIAAVRREAEWEFSVSDNGIGIAEQYHSQIFGVFKRLHPHHPSPGTGIGLAICKKIIERYRGRIWVESTEGQGSTFHFTLPAGHLPDSVRDFEHE